MNLKARVDVNIAGVNVNFQTITVTYFRYRGFFFFFFFLILVSLNTKVSLIFHIKFEPNILSNSEEKVYIVLLVLVSAAILNSRPG